jgi:hypothetical protein
MPVLQYVTKLFTVTWSVVREMVLNDQSFTEVLRVNRRRAIFSVLVMSSFIFSVVSLGADARFVSILIGYVKLQRQYQALETRHQKERDTNQTAEHAPDQTAANIEQPSRVKTPAFAATTDPVDELRSAFNDWTPEN